MMLRYVNMSLENKRICSWIIAVCGWFGVFQLTPCVLLHMSCGRIVSCPHFIKCGCTFLIETVNDTKFQTLCFSELTFVNSNMDLPHTTRSQHIMSTLHKMWCRGNTHTLVQFFLNSFQVLYDAPATYHGLYVKKKVVRHCLF